MRLPWALAAAAALLTLGILLAGALAGPPYVLYSNLVSVQYAPPYLGGAPLTFGFSLPLVPPGAGAGSVAELLYFQPPAGAVFDPQAAALLEGLRGLKFHYSAQGAWVTTDTLPLARYLPAAPLAIPGAGAMRFYLPGA